MAWSKKQMNNQTNQEQRKNKGTATGINPEVIKLDFNQLKEGLSGFVRGTVEEALNGLLQAEAEDLCSAKRHERNEGRKAYRSGSYERNLTTSAGTVKLKVPKLRGASFETQIIERYRRREASVEESLVAMYVAGVSVRRVEDITEALWGERVSPSAVSRLNEKIFERIEEWRNRELDESYPYLFVDGMWLKQSWGGEVKNVSILVAVAVNERGQREVVGVVEGKKEDGESWRGLLRNLRERGLRKVRLIVSDKSKGLISVLPEFYLDAKWQRCVFHFHKNVLHEVPTNKAKEVAAMLKAIHAQESAQACLAKAREVVDKLRGMKLRKAASILEEGIDETLSYHEFPREHHRSLRTNNMLERIIKELRRRTRVVGAFPDGQSALMLCCARLRYIETKSWPEDRKYLDMDKLREMDILRAQTKEPESCPQEPESPTSCNRPILASEPCGQLS
jgi:putative transposase